MIRRSLPSKTSSMRRLIGTGVLGCSLGCAVAEAARVDAPADAAAASEPRRRTDRHGELLAFVPADTPYVLAVLEPAPAGYVRRIEPVLAPLQQAMERELDALDRAALGPEARVLVQQLDGRLSADGLRELGIEPNPRLVLYGIGLAPVLRLRLHDGARLHALLQRIDAADGEPWPSWQHEGVSGCHIEDDTSTLAWGIVGDELVVTAYPRALEAEILPLAFGTVMPARSLADEGFAATMRREHGLLPHGLGRIDLLALTEAFTGAGSGMLAATARAWDVVDEAEPCDTLVRALVARAPELVLGLTELSSEEVSGRWTWRMDGALVDDLATIAGPIPKTRDGVVTAGFALDMARAELTARRWVEDLHRVAPGCVEADAWQRVVLPTAVASLRSGAGALHEYDPRKQDPSYTLVLGLSEPERWLASVLPELSLRDWPARRPVPAEEVLPPSTALDDAFVVRTSDAIALAGGPRARAHARRAARASGRDDDVLLQLHLGLGEIRKAIPPRMLRDALDELDPIERELTEGMLELLGDYEARLWVDDAGLTADWSLELR